MDKRKELKLQYKQMKPPMGILIIRSKINNKCYIETTQNLKATINSTQFKLAFNTHPNRELQKEWSDFGSGNFIIEILEYLEYDKDEIKADYTEDLFLLEMVWKEKLLKQKVDFYKK